MNPDRWKQVSRIYGAVLTKPEAARAAALAELCAGDADLRRDVESLLREQGGELLDQPAAAAVATTIVEGLIGRTLGSYHLDAAIGAGGMGQVYRATDTRLHRTVAIKVLPPALAEDSQFRARFDREAKAIAALNHPHICTLYDVGREGATSFLVMEFVEGENLASRIVRAPVPFEQALTWAIEIAEALAAAHKQEIVHRDLKPGNVMVTKSGVKLLDFGLAKAGGAGRAGGAGGQELLTQAVTMTTPPNAPLTAQGTILGTFQYMAPEQLEGKEADARTDIFAFGALVYELFTGQKAFEGRTQASLIGAIMHAEPPPVSTRQTVAPAALDRIVRKCLAKDPDERWQNAKDLAGELRWVADPASQPTRAIEAPTRSIFMRALPWAATALLGVVAVVLWAMRVPTTVSVSEHGPVVRATILPPRDVYVTGVNPPSRLGLSPDGRVLAFVGVGRDQERHLWIRALGSDAAEMLPGTENGLSPFWSPDGRTLGFFAGGRLKKITVGGGPALTVCGLPGVADAFTGAMVAGGTWNKDGVIVFSVLVDGVSHLYRVGTDSRPELIAGGDLPFFLPDGDHFIYHLAGAPIRLMVGALSGGEPQVLLEGDVTQAMFANGFLIYVRDQVLLAQAFDVARLRLQGDVHVLANQVFTGTGIRSTFSVSQAGVIAYQAFLGGELSQLHWVDAAGTSLGIVGQTNVYENISLSPDGTRVIASIPEPVMKDLWMFDSSRPEPPIHLVRTPDNEDIVAWSHRGDRIAYGSSRGSGSEGRLVIKEPNPASEGISRVSNRVYTIFDWSPDDRMLLASWGSNAGVSLLDVEGRNDPVPLTLRVGAGLPTFSPDGHWIAYQSRESGRLEVYIDPAPGRGGKRVALSVQSGTPRWSRDGKRLFFLSGANLDLMAVDITVQGDVLTAGAPKQLFATRLKNVVAGWPYAVARDGRFLMNLKVDTESAPPTMVISNWTALIPDAKKP